MVTRFLILSLLSLSSLSFPLSGLSLCLFRFPILCVGGVRFSTVQILTELIGRPTLMDPGQDPVAWWTAVGKQQASRN